MLLMFIEVVNLARAHEFSKSPVYYVTPIVLILTYCLVLFLVHFEKVKGLVSSTLLFTFWFLFSLTMIATAKTHVSAYLSGVISF